MQNHRDTLAEREQRHHTRVMAAEKRDAEKRESDAEKLVVRIERARARGANCSCS